MDVGMCEFKNVKGVQIIDFENIEVLVNFVYGMALLQLRWLHCMQYSVLKNLQSRQCMICSRTVNFNAVWNTATDEGIKQGPRSWRRKDTFQLSKETDVFSKFVVDIFNMWVPWEFFVNCNPQVSDWVSRLDELLMNMNDFVRVEVDRKARRFGNKNCATSFVSMHWQLIRD